MLLEAFGIRHSGLDPESRIPFCKREGCNFIMKRFLDVANSLRIAKRRTKMMILNYVPSDVHMVVEIGWSFVIYFSYRT